MSGIIARLIARGRKVAGTADKAARIEDLITQAYEAGRRDAVKDVLITLYDDMANSDHRDALDLISANC